MATECAFFLCSRLLSYFRTSVYFSPARKVSKSACAVARFTGDTARSSAKTFSFPRASGKKVFSRRSAHLLSSAVKGECPPNNGVAGLGSFHLFAYHHTNPAIYCFFLFSISFTSIFSSLAFVKQFDLSILKDNRKNLSLRYYIFKRRDILWYIL